LVLPAPITLVKALAGFAAGLALWLAMSPEYPRLVARPATAIVRAIESPDATRLRPEGTLLVVDRSDFPTVSARPTIALNDLTFNVILLVALFAVSTPLLSGRNVAGLAAALAILYVTHILAVVLGVEATFALRLGRWSEVHYGPFARNAWGAAEHFYRLVGMYAIAFGAWWAMRPPAKPAPSRAAAAKPRSRKRRK
jgi:hypothetical protein